MKISKQLMIIATKILVAEQLIKIATELQQFTGAEANLYRNEQKNSIQKSKEKILNKYRR